MVLLPDSGFRYLSKTYNDEWMRNHGFLESRPEVTADEVVKTRKTSKTVVSASPDDTIGSVIERMTEQSISQVPVVDGDDVVGSVTESRILNRLVESPSARDEPVRTIMGDPFPVVPSSLHLDHLTSYLEGDTGAVLVQQDHGYAVVTKSDLISALARMGRNGNGSS